MPSPVRASRTQGTRCLRSGTGATSASPEPGSESVKEDAVIQAREALTELQRHLELLERAVDLGVAEKQWGLLLHYSDQIYEKLRQAVESGPEKGWYGRLTKTRTSDPLLCYAHQARNVQHHGLSRVTEKGPGIVLFTDGRGHYSGGSGTIIRLVSVENRGRTYLVPDRHGDMGFNPSLLDVAQMLEMAMRAVVQGAEFVQRTGRFRA